MAIKKIDDFNIHENPATNEEPFDVENYVNVNFIKAKEVINNNAEELKQVQNTIPNLQPKEEGKGLSANDFTNEYKEKLDNLENYDDTQIQNEIQTIKQEQITQNEDIQAIEADTAKNVQDITENKEKIKENTEKVKENAKSITQLQNENTELKAECERLNNDKKAIAISVNEKAEYLNLKGTSDSRFNKFEICGNNKQETTSIQNGDEYDSPTFEHPSNLKTVKDNINLKVSNKNIFNVYDKSTGSFPAQYNIDDEDWISLKDIDNTAGTSTKFFNAFTKKTKCLKENTQYCLVFEVKEISGDGIIHVADTSIEGSVGQFKTGVTYNFSDLQSGDIKIHKITTREDLEKCVTLLRTYVAFRAGQAGSITFRLSLLETEPTAENFVYTKHEEQLHTIPVQEEMLEKDRFIKKDGKWYEEHNYLKVAFDGTENWTKSTDVAHRFALSGSILANLIPKENGKHFSSHCSKFNKWGTSLNTIGLNARTVYINKELETVEEFKSYLAEQVTNEMPFTIYCELAEPTLIECTEEQSLILDKIEKTIHTYKDMTYIFSDDEISAICNVSYNVDTKTYIDNQINNQISAISKVLLENGGN